MSDQRTNPVKDSDDLMIDVLNAARRFLAKEDEEGRAELKAAIKAVEDDAWDQIEKHGIGR